MQSEGVPEVSEAQIIGAGLALGAVGTAILIRLLWVMGKEEDHED